MNIEYQRNTLTVEEFIEIRQSVGLSELKMDQVSIALKNTLCTIRARIDGKVVGMGRLVGDGAYVYYFQNVNVMPKYQQQGIGLGIINELLSYIRETKIEGTSVMVLLMSSKGSEAFYEKIGFRSRPNDEEGCGMILNIN